MDLLNIQLMECALFSWLPAIHIFIGSFTTEPGLYSASEEKNEINIP